MGAEKLTKAADALVRRFKTRDPFEIAKGLGIEVMFCSGFESLKGMYRVIKRNRFIFINSEMSPQMQQIVCAHELGHDQLHRQLARDKGLQEFVLYDMTTKPEYEANVMAAEILLDSKEVLDYIFNYNYTVEQIAEAMSTDINLVALKVAELKCRGYGLHEQEHKIDFLK